VVGHEGAVLFLASDGVEKRLCILWCREDATALAEELTGRLSSVDLGRRGFTVKTCELTHANALVVRRHMAFARPQPVGLRTSIGLGDRLGLATPGHLRAVEGTGVAPVLAQQSVREMSRTGRSPEQVMDCAMWGAVEYGWRERFGADADHLKEPGDIERAAAAGFTMFTADPGEHVDGTTDADDERTLTAKFDALPWDLLEMTPKDCRVAYAGRSLPEDCADGPFAESDLIHAAAKYGRAVAHTVRMYRHLTRVMGDAPFEFEASVDETTTPTTPQQHYYISSELRRLGVECVSLAPRLVGEFEKGVDYMGDLATLHCTFARHAAVARRLGPYKLSLHSGSDKFSVYSMATDLTEGLLHVKTAGTSYLEALRAVAVVDPDLFRRILSIARERYWQDRATYHVSAELPKVPRPEDLADDDLPGIMDLFDARQVLHVTFGSVLAAGAGAREPPLRDALLLALSRDEETHYAMLEQHLTKHVRPLAGRR
jgi:hypothetical protein